LFDHGAQLAHVVGPRGAQQGERQLVMNGCRCTGDGGGEMQRQGHHVLGAFAQRRHVDQALVETTVQILSKAAALHRLDQRHVGGRHEAGVGRLQLFASDHAVLALFEQAQQARLQRGGGVTDLVEEQGAAGGGFDQSAVLAVGAGECPAAVAEQLAVHHAVRQAAAIDRHEAPAPSAALVELFGHQLFADTGFALDQHVDGQGREPFDLLQQRLPLGARADEPLAAELADAERPRPVEEQHASDGDHVARLQLSRRADLLAVDGGAVAAADIADHHLLADALDHRMLARHAILVQRTRAEGIRSAAQRRALPARQHATLPEQRAVGVMHDAEHRHTPQIVTLAPGFEVGFGDVVRHRRAPCGTVAAGGCMLR
jgi:hypothetical protein